ncbi:glycosyltransferase [Fortiea contorta]|uniref:glycosyltransferase n=1 Tax=Fortiea contorta TaxID=1892405 RepID=UPI0003485DF1|nr:glycosyltransferase [Fortiea contorta]
MNISHESNFPKASIAVIISAYNQEPFLIEAIESVLRQIKLPNEILISDDASDDNTYEIANFYHKKYPDLIKVNRNPVNLGIVENFNKAVSLTNSEYVCILNADDRYRSDFLQKTSMVLDEYTDVSIAYSDFALFGLRAKIVYDSYPPDRRGLVKANKFYIINFPDFNQETKQEFLLKGNFIHGASLLRRKAFDSVGGYIYQESIPEDYYLFYRIVKQGWNAKRVPLPLLEYRQYSKTQTNTRLATFAQLQFYKKLSQNLYHELQQIKLQLQPNQLKSVDKISSVETQVKFDSTEINLIVFPDWRQPEELLYEDIRILIKSVLIHPDTNKIALLIDDDNFSEEDISFIISDVILDLLQREKLDVTEEPTIKFISHLTSTEQKALLNQTTARISLKIENFSLIYQTISTKIPVYLPDDIKRIQLQDFDSIQSQFNSNNRLFNILDTYKIGKIEPSLLQELRQIKKTIAELWLSTEEIWLAKLYQSEFCQAYKALLNNKIKNELLTEDEQKFVAEILTHITKGFSEPKAIQYLLVAMLYCRPHHLPLSKEIAYIPDWLLNDYVKYLFQDSCYYQELGESRIYYNHIKDWINYIHTSIKHDENLLKWYDFLEYFVPTINFVNLYFNENNLKNIYVKRAEIIEQFLNAKNYELSFEFSSPSPTIKKIRLGILASNFLPGSETFAYLPVYEYISRDFEVILYALNQTGHQLEQYCQSCANSLKLLPENLSAQVNTIRSDDLDILFIATNVTAVTNQICLLATHRLARIQVTSGGSVVTTGMRNMDYYISGTLTDPLPTAQEQYQEKLVKLEGTAHCFSYGTEEGKLTTPVERNSLGIPQDAIVFISGANYFKTVPELIYTWIKIIALVPNSVLVLLPFGPNWSNNYPKTEFINYLKFIFSQHRLATERLIVLDPQPVPDRQDMKEYYKIADIYLDSYPFSGTTSLVEPLQVNLPVVTRKGTCFRSAMGAAMVQTLDISDLVADSEESYIQLAIALGNDPELRLQKSAQIKEKMQGNPSFLDSRSYSKKIGALFKELFNNYLTNTLNQNFSLRDTNLIIFPDWSQPEELLYEGLANVISHLTTHTDKSNLTLLIDTHNIFAEEADMFLSSLIMNLFMENDLDIADGPEISLLGNLSHRQWETLLPRIDSRIALAIDNQQAISQAKAENLPVCDINGLIASKQMTRVFTTTF